MLVQKHPDAIPHEGPENLSYGNDDVPTESQGSSRLTTEIRRRPKNLARKALNPFQSPGLIGYVFFATVHMN